MVPGVSGEGARRDEHGAAGNERKPVCIPEVNVEFANAVNPTPTGHRCLPGRRLILTPPGRR